MDNKNDETIAMTLVKAYAEQTKKITFILVISIIINLLIVCAFLVFISQYDIENTEVQVVIITMGQRVKKTTFRKKNGKSKGTLTRTRKRKPRNV